MPFRLLPDPRPQPGHLADTSLLVPTMIGGCIWASLEAPRVENFAAPRSRSAFLSLATQRNRKRRSRIDLFQEGLWKRFLAVGRCATR